MNVNRFSQSGRMLLSIRMLADPLDELFWEYQVQLEGDTPRLRGCQLYCGQSPLQEDLIYLLPEGVQDFPIDTYSYITPEDLQGPAIFLASDASYFVNGHVLYVDGGILAYIGKQPQ